METNSLPKNNKMAPHFEKLILYLDYFKITPASVKFWKFIEGYRLISIGCFIAYILGYLGVWAPPGSLILLCVVVTWMTVTQHAEYKKHVIIKSRQYIAQNEIAEVQKRLHEIPSWVHFSENEKAEWMNTILKKFWPFVDRYVQDYIRKQVEPQVKEQLPGFLSAGFKFGSITLGQNAPRISALKSFVIDRESDGLKGRQIVADMEWIYPGDCNIQIICTKVPTAGIQDLKISGRLRVVMTPLLPKPPFIGALTFYFTEPPELDFNFTNAANILDLPGVSEALRSMVRDQIDNQATLPNRLVIPLCKDPTLDVVELKHPMPEGILRIGMIEAKDVEEKDITGKSDPYAVVKVGALQYTTKTISNNLNPVWNEFFEAPIYVVGGQTVNIKIFDSDTRTDESLGTASVGVKQFTLSKNGFIDKWISLEGVQKGKLHMMGSWLTLSDDPHDLIAAFHAQKLMPEDANSLNIAYLKVDVLKASNLPRQRQTNLETDYIPSPVVRVTLVGQEEKVKGRKNLTAYVSDTCDPVWQDSFEFFLPNPDNDQILFEVLDVEKSKRLIASATLNASDIMKARKMRDKFELTLKTDSKFAFSKKVATLRIAATLRFLIAGGNERKVSSTKKYSNPGNQPSSSREKNDFGSRHDFGLSSAGNSYQGNMTSSGKSDSDQISIHSMNNEPTSNGTRGKSQYEKYNSPSPARARFVSSLERRASVDSKKRNAIQENPLRRQTSLSALSADCPDAQIPAISLGFNFNQSKNRLTVGVNEARNLSVVFKTVPNSYVTVQLTSSMTKQEQIQTTQIIAREENPKWYKALSFNSAEELLKSSVLVVKLWNHTDKAAHGFAKLSLKNLDLQSRSYWLPIKETLQSVEPLEDYF